jgi:prephenate dehydrogenase
MSKITYDSALVIGMGLIGSSIARVLKEKQLSKKFLLLIEIVR